MEALAVVEDLEVLAIAAKDEGIARRRPSRRRGLEPHPALVVWQLADDNREWGVAACLLGGV